MNNAELNVVSTEETTLAVQVEGATNVPDVQGVTEPLEEVNAEHENQQIDSAGSTESPVDDNAELNIVATEETTLAVQVEDTPSVPDVQGITEPQEEVNVEHESDSLLSENGNDLSGCLIVRAEDTPSVPDIQGTTEPQGKTNAEHENQQIKSAGSTESLVTAQDELTFPEVESDLGGYFEDSPSEDVANVTPDMSEVYDIEPTPDDFDIDKILDLATTSKRITKKKGEVATSHQVEIPKSDLFNVLNIGDMILESEHLSGNGKLNFFNLEVVGENTVCVRFSGDNYYVSMNLSASSKDMIGENIDFFKDNLRSYVLSCRDEDLIIIKDVEKNKYKACLFGGQFYIMAGIEGDEEKRKSVFADEKEYTHSCYVDLAILLEFLTPFVQITEQRSKGEENAKANRVHFRKEGAIIVCADKSFVYQEYPENLTFPKCTVGTTLVNILHEILSDKRNLGVAEIGFCEDKSAIQIKSNSFVVSAPMYSQLSTTRVSEYNGILSSLGNENFVSIDAELLRRVASYSSRMRFSQGILAFRYDDMGNAKCTILHNHEDKDYYYNISLSRLQKNNPSPLEGLAHIDAGAICKLLRALKKREGVFVLVKDERVILKNGNLFIVFYAIESIEQVLKRHDQS